jgi:predicted DNA-binding transcriptional regulator YafY
VSNQTPTAAPGWLLGGTLRPYNRRILAALPAASRPASTARILHSKGAPMSVRLERLLAMEAAVRSGSYPTVTAFMRRFEVSERTVRGDLAFMRDRLNAPLEHDRGRGGYYYTDPTWVLPTMLATEGELLAFFLSVELTRRYLGTTFEAPLRKAAAALALSLPDKVQLDMSLLAQHYTFQPGATASADPALLVVLSEAIHDRWPVEMTYFTAGRGERNQRVIEPYQLYNVRGDWQVIAFDRLRGQVRNFAVSRIEEWQLLKAQQFIRDPDFSLESYLAQGFLAEHGDVPVEVVIWFDTYQARYIRERQAHPTQQIEEHADGTLTLRLQSGALDEVRRWVMGYGNHAEVKAPESLRAEVAAEAAAMVQRYRGG